MSSKSWNLELFLNGRLLALSKMSDDVRTNKVLQFFLNRRDIDAR